MSKCSREDWELLGLEPGEPVQAIKRAFRRQVKQCHPDLCGGDDEAAARLKGIVKAYERVMADAQASARVRSLFEGTSPPQAAAFATAATARAPMDHWRASNLRERMHQTLQVLLLFALLTSPFATVAIGSAVLRPALEHYAAHRAALGSYKRTESDREARLRALLLYRQRTSGAGTAQGGSGPPLGP